MRLFGAVGLVAGGAVAAIWIMLTQRLAELGVDVWMSRGGALLLAFLSLATIGVEEAAGSLGARRRSRSLMRSGRRSVEAGQVSVAAPAGEVSLLKDQTKE